MKKRIMAMSCAVIMLFTAGIPVNASEYVVKKGDMLWKIAKQYDVTIEALVLENNIKNPDLIYVDQQLHIPASDAIEAAEVDIAKILLSTYESGNTQLIDRYMDESFVDHNTTAGNGKEGFVNRVEAAAVDNTTVQIHRVLTEGDYVALHSTYTDNARAQVAFDIFRFEEGKVVEHWDNFNDVAEANPSGRTQTNGPTEIDYSVSAEDSKLVVLGAVNDVMMGKNPANMPSYFEGNKYLQHHVGVGDGVDTAIIEAQKAIAAGTNSIYDEVHIVVAQGDFVLTASKGHKGDVSYAFFDLFRVENGKIAEHWDIVDEIVEEPGNDVGKF